MKRFLEDLKKELSRFNISKEDINEILADHEEMLSQALDDGLTEQEITEKFGNPTQLASDLYNDIGGEKMANNSDNPDVRNEKHQSFPVMDDLKQVDIKLISEDLEIQTHTGQNIEVTFRKVRDMEKYNVSYNNGVFSLSREKGRGISLFRSGDVKIIVLLPQHEKLESYIIETVSGDVEAQNITTKELKLKSTSGDYELKGVVSGNAKLSTVSGDFEIVNMTADSFYASTVSGDVEAKDLKVKGDYDLHSVSGDFEFFNAYGDIATLNTVSGDLDGEEFYINTINLKTVSGDVKISNNNKEKPITIGKKKTLSGDISIK